MATVLFLGFPGSGKTVLLGSLAGYLERRRGARIVLDPKDAETYFFMRQVQAQLQTHRWPKQTAHDSVDTMRWTLRSGNDTLADLEALDYPGEAFRVLFDERVSDAEKNNYAIPAKRVEEAIAKSKQIFLLISRP